MKAIHSLVEDSCHGTLHFVEHQPVGIWNLNEGEATYVTTDTPEYASQTFAQRFGAYCRLKREMLGMSQVKCAELAFGSKTDQKNLTKLENGQRKSVNAATQKALCDVLDIQRWEISLLQQGREPEQILALGTSSSSEPLQIEHLHSRSAFISRAAASVKQSNSFRAQITGPFFCHPASYFRLKAPDLQYPDLDKAISDKVLSLNGRTSEIRLIISNSKRYVQKVKERVPNAELKSFFESCLQRVDEIWGEDRLSGPDLCCAYLGSIHIPYIFDRSVLIQHRKTPMTPTEGGDYASDHAMVEMERNRFDSIFDNNSEGQSKEIFKLKEFFSRLAEGNQ